MGKYQLLISWTRIDNYGHVFPPFAFSFLRFLENLGLFKGTTTEESEDVVLNWVKS
ncbi:MAG: hypothetical protein ACE5OZ_01880 [Candidatus Heimdallarchaeota archaeon]